MALETGISHYTGAPLGNLEWGSMEEASGNSVCELCEGNLEGGLLYCGS